MSKSNGTAFKAPSTTSLCVSKSLISFALKKNTVPTTSGDYAQVIEAMEEEEGGGSAGGGWVWGCWREIGWKHSFNLQCWGHARE